MSCLACDVRSIITVFAVLPVVCLVKAPRCRCGSLVLADKVAVFVLEVVFPVAALYAYGVSAVTAAHSAYISAAVDAETAIGTLFYLTEAYAAVLADVFVINFLKAKLAAGAALHFSLHAAAVDAKTAVVAYL